MAQNTFWRTYGGNSTDYGKDVKETADHGFIVCGSSGSFDAVSGDMYVIKLDSVGNVEWSMLYGGQGVDEAVAVDQVSDKGFFIAGNTTSQGSGGYDGTLVRTDSNGVQLWQRTYGGADWDLFHDMSVVSDGAFLVGQSFEGGFSAGAIWVNRIDLLGDTLWTRRFDAPLGAKGNGITASMDGGCLVAGTIVQTNGDSDAVLLKYDALGILEWDLVIGGDSIQEGKGVAEAPSNDVFLCGGTRRYSVHSEILVAKVTATGSLLWTEHFGQLDDFDGFDVVVKSSGDPVIAGYTKAFGSGGKDQYLMFLNGNGGFIQGRTKGGLNDEEGSAVDRCEDGGFIMCGTAKSYGPGQIAIFLVRTDSSGGPSSDPVLVYADVLAVHDRIGGHSIALHPNPAAPGSMVRVNVPMSGVHFASIQDMHGRTVVPRIAIRSDGFFLPPLDTGTYVVSFSSGTGAQHRARLVVLAE